MNNLHKLMQLCIKYDAIFEIQSMTVKVIKYKGIWTPNTKPTLWASCCVNDEVALGDICGKLENTCE